MIFQLIITLLLAFGLFYTAFRLWGKAGKTAPRILLAVAGILLALPGALFVLYYLHWFDRAVWFYEFRAFSFSELSAAGMGFLAGLLAGVGKGKRIASIPFLLILLILGIVIPYLKPLLTPIPSEAWRELWKDEFCMQSTPSSCGAASATTVLRMYGLAVSERELARECYTSRSGTENWFLARALRSRGLQVHYRITEGLPNDLQLPAIAGVKVGGVGHFISILWKDGENWVTGDPLIGRADHSGQALRENYHFTGFFMEIDSASIKRFSDAEKVF